jgi:hypothetical protein
MAGIDRLWRCLETRGSRLTTEWSRRACRPCQDVAAARAHSETLGIRGQAVEEITESVGAFRHAEQHLWNPERTHQ